MTGDQPSGLLRVPPFPGARVRDLSCRRSTNGGCSDEKLEQLLSEMRRLRVGGDYWGAQPALRFDSYVLISVADRQQREDAVRARAAGEPLVLWLPHDEVATVPSAPKIQALTGTCDPWHLLSGATRLIADADDELALLAVVAGVPVELAGEQQSDLEKTLHQAIGSIDCVDPFTGDPTSTFEAIRLCGFWRQLIDSNRDIGSAVGFAFWKRPTVAPLLWDGSSPVRFVSRLKDVDSSRTVAIWKARTPPELLDKLECGDFLLAEVEDGFIRSSGLGADCIPPLSIVVDRIGVHFDPSRPSELEQLLENGAFPAALLERAGRLRQLIVSSGVGKYGTGGSALARRNSRAHVLVPGQVEDDRAVLCGAGLAANLELLRHVRRERPDAHIIYKPHPDVEAGHRAGTLADADCLRFADEIVRGESISALIDLSDEVHVISSLAGFEALVRGKPVTTYGAPFYAGWGLTTDLGPVPARRRARRSVDELIAAVLLLYPRYLDPVSGLPCPPEILIRRIAEGTSAQREGVVVQLRRLQGRWKKRLARAGLAS